MKLNELRNEVHQNAVDHGWWEDERSFSEIIALIHSELSEALEEHRNGKSPTQTYYLPVDESLMYTPRKPEGIPSELADVIIRVLDYCGKVGIDIEVAVMQKHEYNKTRPYRHGGKRI